METNQTKLYKVLTLAQNVTNCSKIVCNMCVLYGKGETHAEIFISNVHETSANSPEPPNLQDIEMAEDVREYHVVKRETKE